MRPPKLPGTRASFAGFGSDKARLVFLITVMAIFVIGFVFFRIQTTAERVAIQEELVDAPKDIPRMVREPSVHLDFALLNTVDDARRTDRIIREPEPYAHLLGEARKLTPGDLEALGLKAAPAAEILRDPAPYRGLPFEVKGHLESIEVVQGESPFQEIRGTLRAPDGQRYAFTVLREPDVEVGDVVKLQGFFFKLFAQELAPGEWDDSLIYLVGHHLVRSFLTLPPVADLSEAPLYQLRDYDLTDMVDLQEELLFQVLNYVHGLSPEQRAALPYQDVEWKDLRANPDLWRGKPVRIFANFYPTLQWPRTLGPGGENPLDVRTFHDGILKLPHERLFRWIGFEPIPEELLGESRLVYLKGIFFKNFAWENGRGQIMNGPLLVVTGFEPFVLPPNRMVEQFGWAVAGMTTLLVLLFFIGVFADRRSARRFRSDFVRRKRRNLDRVMAGASASRSSTEPAAARADIDSPSEGIDDAKGEATQGAARTDSERPPA